MNRFAARIGSRWDRQASATTPRDKTPRDKTPRGKTRCTRPSCSARHLEIKEQTVQSRTSPERTDTPHPLDPVEIVLNGPAARGVEVTEAVSLGSQAFTPIFTVAARTPLLLLGVFSMAALGCAQSGSWTDTREGDGSAPSISAREPGPAPDAGRMSTSGASVTFDAPNSGADVPSRASDGLIDSLAATYAADMAALADMQRARREAAAEVIAIQSVQTPESRGIPSAPAISIAPTPSTAFGAPMHATWPNDGTQGAASETPKTLVRSPATPAIRPTTSAADAQAATSKPSSTPASAPSAQPNTEGGIATGAGTNPSTVPAGVHTDGTHGGADEAATSTATHQPPLAGTTDPTAGTTNPTAGTTNTTAGATDTAPTTTTAAAPTTTTAAAPASPMITAVNGALELPPPPAPTPTTPTELAKLLAESLAKQSQDSTTPMREWLAFAALAVAEPALELPADFGADLLPTERERITRAHAGFVALGKALQSGAEEIDRTVADRLLGALAGGPKLSIPKVDLCTRVEGFGRYVPLASNKFLARANTRFIVYTELDGFSSELTDGAFVTRLATRVSIQSERDGIDVWQRSPEWTAVVDSSDVRRKEFFLCEIVPVSEYLSVGSYRLKVEVRDESTGTVAESIVPIQIVADPAMAAATE
jgi:hypothetical protein